MVWLFPPRGFVIQPELSKFRVPVLPYCSCWTYVKFRLVWLQVLHSGWSFMLLPFSVIQAESLKLLAPRPRIPASQLWRRQAIWAWPFIAPSNICSFRYLMGHITILHIYIYIHMHVKAIMGDLSKLHKLSVLWPWDVRSPWSLPLGLLADSSRNQAG